MQPWNELKSKPTQTDEEKLVVLSIETIHQSKTMDTQSEDAVYRNLCARIGVEIEGAETPADTEESDSDESDSDETDSDVDVDSAVE